MLLQEHLQTFMCDILRRLTSPNLTKQQYLSSLNEFSRLCRAKKGEELFLIGASRSPAGDGSTEPKTSTSTSINNVFNHDHRLSPPESPTSTSFTEDAFTNCKPPFPTHEILSKDPVAEENEIAQENPIFLLNRNEAEEFTMDDVFRW